MVLYNIFLSLFMDVISMEFNLMRICNFSQLRGYSSHRSQLEHQFILYPIQFLFLIENRKMVILVQFMISIMIKTNPLMNFLYTYFQINTQSVVNKKFVLLIIQAIIKVRPYGQSSTLNFICQNS